MIEKYFDGTSKLINLSVEIGKLLGIVDSTYLRKPPAQLRKKNRLKSIQSSLAIDGNTLSLTQVSALFDNKAVVGNTKNILAAKNIIRVYQQLSKFEAFDESSFRSAHQLMMSSLDNNAGTYRTVNVGVSKGKKVFHKAPPAWNVDHLMKNLFLYLKNSEDNIIVKSCVFHYEMEFIHPFTYGNGSMGRLWQTIILMNENPVFEYLSLESQVKKHQDGYQSALSFSDKGGLSTQFVEYMHSMIKKSLHQLLRSQRTNLTDEERMHYFRENSSLQKFTRKDYMDMFKDISSSTASRDLRMSVENGVLFKKGDNRTTKYEYTTSRKRRK